MNVNNGRINEKRDQSHIIFSSVLILFWKKLQQNESFGYPINDTKYITTPFADDFNLITTNKRTHQRLLNEISTRTKSIHLKLKPMKCKSLCFVSGKQTPIVFKLGDNDVNPV